MYIRFPQGVTVDLFVPMLALGLVTSLHCISMCGPMVVGYALKGTEDASPARRLIPNLAYQGAKITSYVLVGLLLGAVGSAFDLDAVRPYVMFLAGGFMIVIGLGMTGRFPWAARLTPRPPKFLLKALSKTRRTANERAAAGESSLATPVTLGLLTGLFPCAPLMSAQLTAAASGSALTGALAMFAFGLGTAPLMLGFGTASSMLPTRLKERAMLLLAVVVMVFGLVYIDRGAMLVGSPVTAQSIRQAVLGGPAQPTGPNEYVRGVDGVVEIPLAIVNTQFQPQALTFPADEPVRLIVDRQEDNACSDQIAIPQMGVLQDLQAFGTTVVEIPAAAAGSYTLTCGMGMMSGRIVVGDVAATSSGGGPSAGLLLGLALAAGAGAWALSRKPAPAGARQSDPQTETEPRSAAVLGLSPNEVVLVLGIVGIAIVAGLALGGFFGS